MLPSPQSQLNFMILSFSLVEFLFIFLLFSLLFLQFSKGVGAELKIFSLKHNFECLSTTECLKNGNIHGIRFLEKENKQSNSEIICVFGQKRVILYEWIKGNDENFGKLEVLWEMDELSDWLWDVLICNYDKMENRLQVFTITAHNLIQIWDVESKKLVTSIQSPENSILYSAKLYYSLQKDINVACGTVFNQVLEFYFLKFCWFIFLFS